MGVTGYCLAIRSKWRGTLKRKWSRQWDGSPSRSAGSSVRFRRNGIISFPTGRKPRLPLMPLSADPYHALTVDLEEWHHVCGVPSLNRERPSLPSRVDGDTRRTLDLLDRTGTRATFFVLGSVAQSHPRLVEAVASAGHEIACHGHD